MSCSAWEANRRQFYQLPLAQHRGQICHTTEATQNVLELCGYGEKNPTSFGNLRLLSILVFPSTERSQVKHRITCVLYSIYYQFRTYFMSTRSLTEKNGSITYVSQATHKKQLWLHLFILGISWQYPEGFHIYDTHHRNITEVLKT